MKKSKLIALGLALSVAGSILAGCTSESEEKTNNYGVSVKDNNGYVGTFNNTTELAETKETDSFIIYVYASSCVYCNKNKPMINEYAVKDTALPIYGYDLDNEGVRDVVQTIVDTYKVPIEGTPTTLFIKNGKLESTLLGVQKLEDMPTKNDIDTTTGEETVKDSEAKEKAATKDESDKATETDAESGAENTTEGEKDDVEADTETSEKTSKESEESSTK